MPTTLTPPLNLNEYVIPAASTVGSGVPVVVNAPGGTVYVNPSAQTAGAIVAGIPSCTAIFTCNVGNRTHNPSLFGWNCAPFD